MGMQMFNGLPYGGIDPDGIHWSDAKTSVKKNLLLNQIVSQTLNGITFTVNADGSISLSGTASADTHLTIGNIVLEPNTYILTGIDHDIAGGYGKIQIHSEINGTGTSLSWGSRGQDTSAEQKTLDNTTDAKFLLDIYNGFDTSNIVVKPMVRLASIGDDTYVPYVFDNVELKEEIDSKADVSALPVKTTGVQALTGATSVTIQNANIHTTSFCVPFADNGSNTPTVWKTMTQTEGQVVLTFDALTADTTFYLTIIN